MSSAPASRPGRSGGIMLDSTGLSVVSGRSTQRTRRLSSSRRASYKYYLLARHSTPSSEHVRPIHSASTRTDRSKIGRAGGLVPTRSQHDGPVGTLRWILGGHRDRERQRHRGSRGGGAAGVLVLAVPSMEDPESRGAETSYARESVSKERTAEQAGGAYDMNRAARWVDGTAWHRRRSIA